MRCDVSDIGNIKPSFSPLTEFGKKSRSVRALNGCTLLNLSIDIGLSPAGICSVERGENPAKGGTVNEWQAVISEYYFQRFGIAIDQYVIPPPTEEVLEFNRQWNNLLNGVKNGGF